MGNLTISTLSLSDPPRSPSSPLLSLAPEIRQQIWTDLLQSSAENTAPMYSGYFQLPQEPAFFSTDAPLEYQVCQPQLLRVCRQIFAEATPIFYANIVVLSIPTANVDQDWLDAVRRLAELIKRPRRVNIRKIFLVVHAGDDNELQEEVVRRDAPLVEEICEALAYCGRLERVWVQLVDWTIPNAFGGNRENAVRLLKGLGHLYAENATCNMMLTRSAEDLQWAMMRPGRTFPLAVLHWELVKFMDEYDPDVNSGAPGWDLKRFFKREGKEASDGLEPERFYLNLGVAIDYVLEVLRRGLSEPANTGDSEGDERIIERARRGADQLLRMV